MEELGGHERTWHAGVRERVHDHHCRRRRAAPDSPPGRRPGTLIPPVGGGSSARTASVIATGSSTTWWRARPGRGDVPRAGSSAAPPHVDDPQRPRRRARVEGRRRCGARSRTRAASGPAGRRGTGPDPAIRSTSCPAGRPAGSRSRPSTPALVADGLACSPAGSTSGAVVSAFHQPTRPTRRLEPARHAVPHQRVVRVPAVSSRTRHPSAHLSGGATQQPRLQELGRAELPIGMIRTRGSWLLKRADVVPRSKVSSPRSTSSDETCGLEL